MHGGGGDDIICGDSGNDRLYGQSGNDRLFGEEGNDYLDGGAGTDRLAGFRGNDTLTGSTGNDSLDGGDGHDFTRNWGNDALWGGQGRTSSAAVAVPTLFMVTTRPWCRRSRRPDRLRRVGRRRRRRRQRLRRRRRPVRLFRNWGPVDELRVDPATIPSAGAGAVDFVYGGPGMIGSSASPAATPWMIASAQTSCSVAPAATSSSQPTPRRQSGTPIGSTAATRSRRLHHRPLRPDGRLWLCRVAHLRRAHESPHQTSTDHPPAKPPGMTRKNSHEPHHSDPCGVHHRRHLRTGRACPRRCAPPTTTDSGTTGNDCSRRTDGQQLAHRVHH